jgi:hypothetical protein
MEVSTLYSRQKDELTTRSLRYGKSLAGRAVLRFRLKFCALPHLAPVREESQCILCWLLKLDMPSTAFLRFPT